jgi:hypothetical protein
MICKRRHESSYAQIIEQLDLDEFQKLVLQSRYVALLNKLHSRTSTITFAFYTNKTIVSIGSLIVPALLSIQYTDTGPGQNKESFSFQIYWATWVLSLLVSICNALLTLFKIDKKFIYLHSDIEHLTSEGWQYAQLSGRYSGFYTPGELPTHRNQYKFFCHIIEKIRMKEVESEFSNKLENSAAHQSDKKTSTVGASPLTPLRPNAVEIMKQFLEEAKLDENTLKTLIGNGSSSQQTAGGTDTNSENTRTPTQTRRPSQSSETSEASQVSVHINMQESSTA